MSVWQAVNGLPDPDEANPIGIFALGDLLVYTCQPKFSSDPSVAQVYTSIDGGDTWAARGRPFGDPGDQEPIVFGVARLALETPLYVLAGFNSDETRGIAVTEDFASYTVIDVGDDLQDGYSISASADGSRVFVCGSFRSAPFDIYRTILFTEDGYTWAEPDNVELLDGWNVVTITEAPSLGKWFVNGGVAWVAEDPTDAATWVEVEVPFASAFFWCPVAGKGILLGSSSSTPRIASSADLSTWDDLIASPFDGDGNLNARGGIESSDGWIYVGGDDFTADDTPGLIRSGDAGATFSVFAPGLDPGPSGFAGRGSFTESAGGRVFSVGESTIGATTYPLIYLGVEPPPPPPSYSVTYDGDGSDGGTPPVDADSPYIAGSTVTVLHPGDLTLTDYVFRKWNTAADGSGATHHAGVSFSMPAYDLTLYAQWVAAPVLMSPGRRVGVAFDDGPLEPNPTWTYLDDATVFPPQFVAGYDTHVGRQTLLSQTDTGTATVYINDRAGLLDDRNDDSPYQGKLSGRQIILQLWNPVTEEWEPQFRGLIDDYRYDIDPATDAHGEPINASVQLECVDMFDYLNGFGLTPGLAGQVPPPAGMEDGVYYAATAGSVQDRFFEILTDAKVDPDMYATASGNTKIMGVKYDPDESALTALRDAADAELPFIANIYVNRFGVFCFRGRYSRFNPVEVRLGPGDWDFNCWPLGDGVAIRDDLYYNPVMDEDQPRGQVRVLSYNRDRGDLVNAAMCWPQGLPADEMPEQVYALLGPSESGGLYGKHDAPPMSDLLTGDYVGPGSLDPADDGKTQCFLFAKLLVENKKAPLLSITALQLKSIRPDDHRAAATWGAMCGADISHIVNVAVGYPGGTGLTGQSPQDDYYVEGRALRVRPLNPEFDYVECDLEVSRAEWSMDTHEVFPPYGS